MCLVTLSPCENAVVSVCLPDLSVAPVPMLQLPPVPVTDFLLVPNCSHDLGIQPTSPNIESDSFCISCLGYVRRRRVVGCCQQGLEEGKLERLKDRKRKSYHWHVKSWAVVALCEA
jgi:hypothetical protein